jgi:PAS domain S-box-containing protein
MTIFGVMDASGRKMLNAGWARKVSLLIRVVLLGAIPMLIMIALGVAHILESREETLTRAHDDALQLVRTLEAGVSATLQSAEIAIDVIMGSARSVLENGNRKTAGQIPDSFVRTAQDWQFIQSMSFIDENGRMVHSLMREPDGQIRPSNFMKDVDFNTRPTFTAHKTAARDTDQIYVSEMKLGEQSKEQIFVLTKGAWSAAGEFLGVAAVAVRKRSLDDIFNTAKPIVDGAVTLFRSDGMLMFASPGTTLEVGTIYPNSRLFRTAVHEAREGAYSAFTAEDGKERIFAFSVSERYPFVIVAAIPMASVMEDWEQSTFVLIAAIILSGIVIVTLLVSLVRRYRANLSVQDALRQSETRLKDLVECSSDYQWETDENSIFRHFGGQGSEMYPDIVGKHSSVMIAQVAEPTDMEELLRLREQHLPIRNMIIPTLGRDGEVRWIRNSANPIFDENGVFRGYRGTGADITEMRRQRKMIDAQRKDEALGRLTSGLAHEINNLLQPILIYSAPSAANKKNEDTVLSLTKIRKAAESASEIVKNVLSFARESPPRKERVDLVQAVNDTVEVVAARVPPGIRVHVALPQDMLYVWVDRTGFSQALTNLLNNSIESIAGHPPGRGRIVIAADNVFVDDRRLGLRDGHYCVLSVADDGPGILPETFEKIFDPFFTTKSQAEGTGLGLSVVVGLTKSWGGAIDVQSVPNQKTIFSLYLPVAEQQLQAAQ